MKNDRMIRELEEFYSKGVKGKTAVYKKMAELLGISTRHYLKQRSSGDFTPAQERLLRIGHDLYVSGRLKYVA